MYLQLAENKKRKRGAVRVESYTRSSNVNSHSRKFPLRENHTNPNPHIFIPNFETGGGIYVREDKFDNMPDHQWAMFMDILAPYQPQVQNGTMSEPMFLSGKAERKARRDEKKDAKMEKKASKEERKTDRNERKNQRRESKDEARESRESRKSERGGFDWDKAKDTAGGLISKFTNRGGGDDGGGDTGGGDTGGGGTPMSTTTKYIIGGSIAVVVIGGIAYAMTRPKVA